MRYIPGTLLIALATALIYWLLFGLSPGNAIADPGSAASTVDGTQDKTQPNPREGQAKYTLATGLREVLETRPLAPAVELIAIRRDTQEPIAEAVVGFTVDGTPADFVAARRGNIDYFLNKGQIKRTDERGHSRIPVGKRGALAVLVYNDLFATAILPPRSLEPLVVELVNDHTLIVSVAEPNGAPAQGVTIRIGKKNGIRSRKVGRTNREGKLQLPHTQALSLGQKNGFAVISAEGYGVESKPVDINLFEKPVVQVTLGIPDSGTITFQLQSESGEPFNLSGFNLPALLFKTHINRPNREDWVDSGLTFDSNGRTILRHVALNRFYSVRAHGLMAAQQVGKGPTTTQRSVEIPVVVPANLTIVKARAIDLEGKPIPGRPIVFSFSTGSQRASSTSRTNESGDFKIAIPDLPSGSLVDVSCQLRIPDRPHLSHQLRSPWTIRPGVNDIGYLTFAEAPLTLRGHLTVPKSLESIQHISFTIQTMKGSRWVSARGLSRRWLRGRSFEIHGNTAAGARFRLKFERGDYLPLRPLEFTPGTKDVEITLRPRR